MISGLERMSTAKVRIRVGVIELEYEGSPEFLGEGLAGLIQQVAELSRSSPLVELPQQSAVAEQSSAEQSIVGPLPLTLSTSSIAARMDAKTGPDLILCAMAHLELVKGLTSYERKTILDEMRSASGYFTTNMSGNCSSYVANLVKAKKVNEISTGKFCLSASERKKIEAAIANEN